MRSELSIYEICHFIIRLLKLDYLVVYRLYCITFLFSSHLILVLHHPFLFGIPKSIFFYKLVIFFILPTLGRLCYFLVLLGKIFDPFDGLLQMNFLFLLYFFYLTLAMLELFYSILQFKFQLSLFLKL